MRKKKNKLAYHDESIFAQKFEKLFQTVETTLEASAGRNKKIG